MQNTLKICQNYLKFLFHGGIAIFADGRVKPHDTWTTKSKRKMSQVSFDGQSLFFLEIASLLLQLCCQSCLAWLTESTTIYTESQTKLHQLRKSFPIDHQKPMGGLRTGVFWTLKKANPQLPLLSHTPGKSTKRALPAILQLPFNTVGHFDHCKNCTVNCAKSAQPPFFPNA